jgi:hypothetical protein
VLNGVVSGSPADVVGLKTGKLSLVYRQPDCDVTMYSYDDVVRMVEMSTGTLALQVCTVKTVCATIYVALFCV